jgi:hypothetical protein
MGRSGFLPLRPDILWCHVFHQRQSFPNRSGVLSSFEFTGEQASWDSLSEYKPDCRRHAVRPAERQSPRRSSIQQEPILAVVVVSGGCLDLVVISERQWRHENGEQRPQRHQGLKADAKLTRHTQSTSTLNP